MLGGLQQPVHPRPSVCAELLPPVWLNWIIIIIIIIIIVVVVVVVLLFCC